MTYPASSDVAAGQPTAVDHYNNLRADALYFGQVSDDAVDLGTLLEKYQDNLNLVYLATNRIRVEASPTSPVALVIDQYPLQATANVDLPVGSTPGGAAATYYVFAERADDSTTFTLEVNTSATPWAGARLIGSFYWDGSAIERPSIQTLQRDFLKETLSYNPGQICQGRLTLTTATPITTSDVTTSTLYFTPFNGNKISLYNSLGQWVDFEFDEITLDFTGCAAGDNYDIFAYYTGTAVALEKLVWSNDTTRATAITLQDGRYIKNGDATRLYLGTVRTSALNNLTDALLQRYVFNYYNRVPRRMYFNDATASWVYATATVRQMNNAAANKFEFVVGVDDQPVRAIHKIAFSTNSARLVKSGFGLDATNAFSASGIEAVYDGDASENTYDAFFNNYIGAVGYHYLAACEYATAGATTTWYGGDYHRTEGFINA